VGRAPQEDVGRHMAKNDEGISKEIINS
jgi:hypothetical protein